MGHDVTYIHSMQTSLHIAALVEELKREVVGGSIVGTEFYKKERAAYFFVKKDKSRLALGFIYHPAGSGVFLVPASKVQIETREKPWPIFDIEGGTIADVEQYPCDRIFRLAVEKDGVLSHLICEALGPNGNIWLLDKDLAIGATLRKKKHVPGKKYEPAPLPEKINPLMLSASVFDGAASGVACQSPAVFLQKNILGFNRSLAREVLRRAGAGERWDVDPVELTRCVKDIARRFTEPGMGYLHHIGETIEVYPFKLSPVAEPPQKYKTLSLAVMAMCRARRGSAKTVDESKTIRAAVRRMLKRLERRLTATEQDLRQATDYDRYRRQGELLQINFDRIKKGMDEIKVDDVYKDPPSKTAIPLDPALAPKENVEAYFKKYRKGRDGVKLLSRRLEITGDELSQLAEIQTALDTDFESARERYRQELAALMPQAATGGREVVPRRPYREHLLSTGLKILVGRDGADNDRTTFDFARPYELWFHTQQCPGSHVVMKYPNKSFEPSKGEIEEAAAVAAFHSRARNDSLVPVIYTERRYVRKPRKAKPGLVTGEREKSIMVAPASPSKPERKPA